ncbi:MAG: hypothetical protein M3Q03_03540, partial [Chloroflexota bacterium]|nr:hypothetical protein [Chloroflexota bacterium]
MRPGFKSLLTVSVVASVVLVAAVVRSAAPLQSDAVASPVASANGATPLVSPAATPAPAATPMGTPTIPVGVGGGSLPGDGAPSSAALLSAVMLAVHRPNELGRVPVLEWHVFTTDPEAEDEYTRTIDDFRADLEWLYAHDFYVVSLR